MAIRITLGFWHASIEKVKEPEEPLTPAMRREESIPRATPDAWNFAEVDEDGIPANRKLSIPPEVKERHRYLVRYRQSPDGTKAIVGKTDLHADEKYPIPPSSALWVQVSESLIQGDEV